MEELIKEVMESCGLSHDDAEREIRLAGENLICCEPMTIDDVCGFCDSLGVSEDYLFDNPEMLLAFL